MNWKFWKRNTTREEGESSTLRVEASGELDPDRWADGELGVESLYLPFGVRKGWADEPYKSSFTPLYTHSSAKIPTGAFPANSTIPRVPTAYTGNYPARPKLSVIDTPLKDIHSLCNALLYRHLGITRTDGSEILEPSRCAQPKNHAGKHGIEDYTYLHPDEYPNRIGRQPFDLEYLSTLESYLQQALDMLSDARRIREL